MSSGLNYPVKTDPATTDQALTWDNANSRWVRVAFSAILALFDSAGLLADYKKKAQTQIVVPTTGFSIYVTDNGDDTHLILNFTGALSGGTIFLPLGNTAVDKLTVTVSSTDAVTTLVVDGNGSDVKGAPTALAANDYFTLKYDISTMTWYRIG